MASITAREGYFLIHRSSERMVVLCANRFYLCKKDGDYAWGELENAVKWPSNFVFKIDSIKQSCIAKGMSPIELDYFNRCETKQLIKTKVWEVQDSGI